MLITIFYGSGDIDVTRAGSLNVTQAGASTASEMDGKVFTVIQAQNASVTGTLTGAASMTIVEGINIPALIDFTVINLNTNGKPDLTLSAAKLPVNSLAVHPNLDSANHLSTAQLLINATNSGNASIIASLDTLTNAQLASHFDSIHAEPYSSHMTVALEQTEMMIDAVLSGPKRTGITGASQTYTEAQTLSGERFWLDVSAVKGDVKASSDLGNFEYNLENLAVGRDLKKTRFGTLGGYFAVGSHKMDEHDASTIDFSSDVYHVGVYLNDKQLNDWDLRAALGFAKGHNESKRVVQLGSSQSVNVAKFDSHSAYFGIKAIHQGKKFSWGSLHPELGVEHTSHFQDSLTESGDANLSLAVDEAKTHALVTAIGIETHLNPISIKVPVSPTFSVRYEHDWYAKQHNEHEVRAALKAHPAQKQTFVGQSRGENTLTLALGLSSATDGALAISGGLNFAKSSHGEELGAGINLSYRW
jgi:hypothetical protein